MGVKANVNHKVRDIDFQTKKIKVRKLGNGEEFEDSYDKLILTFGSWPIVAKFEGGDLGD